MIKYAMAREPKFLTPFALGKALILPFLLVPGGMALMLGLAAATVGLDPNEFISDFLADSAVILSPLALKCALIWAIYAALYLLMTWVYWPHHESAFESDGLDPGLSSIICPSAGYLLQVARSAVAEWLALLLKLSVWCGIRSDWFPGVHPQIE